MRNIFAVGRKELRSYFASPIAYIVATVFLVISGLIFFLTTIASGQATLTGLLGTIGIILLFLSPILTMRLFAEEQSTGTIELLLTAPVRDWEVVIGKYLAALGLLLVMLLLTAYYPILLFVYGSPDLGPLLSGYLVVVLVGGSFLSVGLLTSTLTKNQIVAAVVAIGILMVFWFISGAASFAPPITIGDFTLATDVIVRYLALSEHTGAMTRGLIELRDIVYYLSFIALFLFLSIRSIETRRWR